MLTVGNTRPYPPTGLTTRLWAGVGLEWVDFADLTTTQDGVSLAGLLGHDQHSRDPYPHVVAWGGRLYLEDGHCRVGRAILRRHTRMSMRVYRMDEEGAA